MWVEIWYFVCFSYSYRNQKRHSLQIRRAFGQTPVTFFPFSSVFENTLLVWVVGKTD